MDKEIINRIESQLIALHRSFYQHKGWERLKKDADVNLGRPEAALLKVLATQKNGSCKMQQLSTYLGIEAPSVSRTAQSLEVAGLVTRKTDKDDARISHLKINAKGIRQLNKLQSARRRYLEALIKDWPTSDKQKLAELLEKLSAQVEIK